MRVIGLSMRQVVGPQADRDVMTLIRPYGAPSPRGEKGMRSGPAVSAPQWENVLAGRRYRGPLLCGRGLAHLLDGQFVRDADLG